MKAQTATALGGLAVLAVGITAQAQYTYTTLRYPNTVGEVLGGISGTNIGGSYQDTNGNIHGFLFNGSTWTTLDDPVAPPSGGTQAIHISGTNIVGVYVDTNNTQHGFLLNGTNWITLDDPFAGTGPTGGTLATGISGTNLVGVYGDSIGVNHGFLLSATNWSSGTNWFYATNWIPLDDPVCPTNKVYEGTWPSSISGVNVVGFYSVDGIKSDGFLYNCITKTWTTLDDPKAGAYGTAPNDISGSNIVGVYWDTYNNAHGFLYTMGTTNWTTLDDPLAPTSTKPQGVSGLNIVGVYGDSANNFQGFLATPIPHLTISPAGSGLQVSWPYWNRPSMGWTLEQNPDLTMSNWTASSATVADDGTNNFITIPSPTGSLFFRLRQQ